jgi:hypothetical protein
MADPQHLERLEDGGAWNRRRREQPSKPDFVRADFKHAVLDG